MSTVKALSRKELQKLYDFVGHLSEGLIWVIDNRKHFHVHPDGTPAYEERYDRVYSFLNGSTPAMKDGRWFHIGLDGKPLYEERYDMVYPFKNGMGLVVIGDDSFYINPDSTRIRFEHPATYVAKAL